METQNFLEYMQILLTAKEINLAKRFYYDIKNQIKPNNTTVTLEILFKINDYETELGETSFFTDRTSITELEECYERLKFYLRRFDFNIPIDNDEFIHFILNNKISSAAILFVTQTSIIHQIKVLNQVAILLAGKELLSISVQLLNCAYQNSKDDTTLFHFAFVLWKTGNYKDAKTIVNQISTQDKDVLSLKKLIKKKVK